MLTPNRPLWCLLPLCIAGCARLPVTPQPAPAPLPAPPVVQRVAPLLEPVVVVVEPRPVAALVVGKRPAPERRAALPTAPRPPARYVPVPPANAHELLEVALTHRPVMALQALSDAEALGPIVEMAVPPDDTVHGARPLRTASTRLARQNADRPRLP